MTNREAAEPLSWLENDTPVSQRFGDHFFETTDGRAETREVFLGGNGLPERWLARETFTIGELGFGTGLNFAETAMQWRKTARAGAVLTYIAFEAYPLECCDLARALKRWEDLSGLADYLIGHWPKALRGSAVEVGGVRLHLVPGEAGDALPKWFGENRHSVDAWYLDGFSPAKNPQMWEASLLASAFENTASGGTFSTYTAAGWVKRNLLAAGFEVQKVPGFGRKRERLQGTKA